MRSNEIKTSLTFNSFQTARTPRNRCSIQCIVFGRHLVPIRGPGGPGWVRVDQASGAAVGDHEAAKSAANLADLWPFDLCLGGGEVMGKHWGKVRDGKAATELLVI